MASTFCDPTTYYSPLTTHHSPLPVVGLIGGIGSGKSVVAEMFRQRGAKVISGDLLGHEALCQPDIRAAIVRRWGAGVLKPDGTVCRRRLGEIVFANPQERRALETLVFPWIERRIQEEIDVARKQRAWALIVLDAAILLEAGWNKACDRIVFVHAPRTVRMRRLQEQRGWSAKELQARESAQMSLTEKVSRADYALDSSGPPERVAQQVDDLLHQWNIVYQRARGM